MEVWGAAGLAHIRALESCARWTDVGFDAFLCRVTRTRRRSRMRRARSCSRPLMPTRVSKAAREEHLCLVGWPPATAGCHPTPLPKASFQCDG